MNTTTAMYMLVLLVGHVRVEVHTAVPLQLEQCYRAGEAWVARGPGYSYRCEHTPNVATAKRSGK